MEYRNTDPPQCPICLGDFRGAQIPNTKPPQFYSKIIGCEIRGVYDGVLFWECPYCQGRFHRFREGTDLWVKANPYISKAAV